ncbi:MAG TPA: hypothetical protein VME44_24105 [Streptosporangiaceae bacterium]|nr:hypothetical protein [Streptosporangiaceae bacterium]
MPTQPASEIARQPGFEALHAEGRQALRTGTSRPECAPTDGASRWAMGAVLRPDSQAAQMIEQVAVAAAAVVGPNHWLAGAARSSHLSLRRHLEPRRRQVSPADPLVDRYAAALRSAAKATGPVRFTLAGLILTPVSVMATAVPADTAADDLAAAFDAALYAEGCRGTGAIPGLWYVNLAYFTGPVRDAEELIAWVEARRAMNVADVRVTRMQIVRWQYTTTGMVPFVLASFRQR